MGVFCDDDDLSIGTSPTPIRLNKTQLSDGVTIGGAGLNEITISEAGVYNISFSSQIQNAANQRRNVTIWLSKNCVAEAQWVSETSTDITLGTSADSDRSVAAWNFFVNAQAGDRYTLLIQSSRSGVTINGGTSLNGANLPQIPSTILTVNQVG